MMGGSIDNNGWWKKMNIGKNIMVSLAMPHKIKVTVSIPFCVDLDVQLYVLPALPRNNYMYVSEKQKCERIYPVMPPWIKPCNSE